VALRVITMAELRREVLLEAERTGEPVNSICQRFGISRQTYYRYRRRLLLEGLAGLEDKNRKPHHSPGRMDPQIEMEICRLRKTHPRWGARRIHAELTRAGIQAPAVSSIHQALRRNHLVATQPPRRRKAFKRFQREIANDLWQIDATQVGLVTRKKAWVLDMIDDHSRYLLSALASPAPTVEAAWDCFEEAASRYGLPRQVLSDNGLCFTGRLHGVQVEFERNLKELDVELINAGPYHPQTLGKLERFHKTLKLWLADEGPAEDTAHLQELLEFGFGAGILEGDHTGAGHEFWAKDERIARFREAVEIVDRALREEVVTYSGRYYRTTELWTSPGPLQHPRPPIVIAAHSAGMLRIAAKYADTWNSYGGFLASEEEIFRRTADRSRRLDDLCVEIGRDPSSVSRSFLVFESSGNLAGAPPTRAFSSADAFRDLAGRYAEIGVSELIFYFPGIPEHRRVMEEVATLLPDVR
jgi:transposase InsO family protein